LRDCPKVNEYLQKDMAPQSYKESCFFFGEKKSNETYKPLPHTRFVLYNTVATARYDNA